MSAYRSLILSHAPYAYWPLHEASGATSASDVSGNARHSSGGTAPTFGGGTYWVDPDEPRSAALSGTPGTGLTAPWAQASLANTFTVECWCRPTQAITLYSESTSGTAVATGPTNRFVFYPDQGGSASTCGVGLSVGTNGVQSVEHTSSYAPCLGKMTVALSPDRLHHIALKVNAKQHILYVNGQKDTRLTSGKTSVYAPITFQASGTNLSNVGFNGDVCEIAWYNAGLTDAQIISHYTAGLLAWGSTARTTY